MHNLLKNYQIPIVKQDISNVEAANILEVRNLNEQNKSIILEVGPNSELLTVPFPTQNNDSIQNFPRSFSVCLQSVELDCSAGGSVTSNITIETTEKYEININGVTTVLYGDALISYLESYPDLGVVIE
jgi:hypothetical protein